MTNTFSGPLVKGKHKEYNPFLALQRDINRLFGSGFDSSSVPSVYRDADFPSIDVKENKGAFTIKIELPGSDKDNLDLSITDNYLSIKGEKKEEKEREEGDYIHRECSYGAFQRSLSLPDIADGDKAEASFADGVLTVRVPKRKEAKERTKKVSIR